jgi:kumamolisin
VFARFLAAGASLSALLATPAIAPVSHAAPPFFTRFTSPAIAAAPYTPSKIAAAYNYQSLIDAGTDGRGETVALLEIDGFDPADLTAFDKQYKLPAPRITQTYIGGHTYKLDTNGETTMDIEWLHALAPGATIQVYYMNNHLSERKSWLTLAKALHKAKSHGSSIVSISLGACGTDALAAPTSKAFADLERAGVSVFVSSGDDGDHAGPVRACGNQIGVAYPGSDPNVVAIGGTSLQLSADNTISAETAWDRSGGGRETALTRAPWQVASDLPHDTARWAPDVAFLADPHTGVRFLYHGVWHVVGGTSLGAPAWAAAWALIRQDARDAGTPVGAAAPLLYTIGNSDAGATAFHDVTTGTNGTYVAGPGWDPVTGWGTPDVADLASVVSTNAAK